MPGVTITLGLEYPYPPLEYPLEYDRDGAEYDRDILDDERLLLPPLNDPPIRPPLCTAMADCGNAVNSGRMKMNSDKNNAAAGGWDDSACLSLLPKFANAS